MMPIWTFAGTAAVLSALIPGAFAQQPTITQTPPTPAVRGTSAGIAQGTQTRLAVNDSLFAFVAATSGQSELAISEIGRQKATDPELKRFSEKMIEDHNKLNRELTSLASQKRYTLPTQLDPRAQFCSQNLSGLSGEEFDACYAREGYGLGDQGPCGQGFAGS